MIKKTLATEFKKNPMRMLGGLLAGNALLGMKKKMDYTEYGGAPLLGVNGGCIVCHGRSNAKAIRNAIRVAAEFVENDVNGKIRTKISELHLQEQAGGLSSGDLATAGERREAKGDE